MNLVKIIEFSIRVHLLESLKSMKNKLKSCLTLPGILLVLLLHHQKQSFMTYRSIVSSFSFRHAYHQLCFFNFLVIFFIVSHPDSLISLLAYNFHKLCVGNLLLDSQSETAGNLIQY